MKSPCCRLINLLDKEKIILMKSGADSDGIFRSNSQRRIESETNFGWDMTNEKEGYPCEKLGINGCNIYEDRPDYCRNFPNTKKILRNLSTCSISFNDIGEKIGTCDKCNEEVQG